MLQSLLFIVNCVPSRVQTSAMLSLVIDAGLVGSTDFHWEGYRESGRCSRDTCPESYITKYTSTRTQSWVREVCKERRKGGGEAA